MTANALSQAPKIRVLVVDDSAFMRHSIVRLLTANPDFEVIGTAVDGVDGVKRALELRPDVITMDVEMPRMDGVSAVREIMQTIPTPVIMLSTMTVEGAEITIRALEAGAVECVAKPSGLSHELHNVADELSTAVHRAHLSHLRRHHPMAALPTIGSGKTTGTRVASHLVLLGCSTGGPPALTEVVPHLPADLEAGVIVVQHMPAGFTGALARRLNQISPLEVAEASAGDLVLQGRVLVAPGNFHLEVGPDHSIRLNQGPTLHGVRPSVDIALKSVAPLYGKHLTVAILTGMGRDGAEGATVAEQGGAAIFVQDEPTCVVYGMPRVARELTRTAKELPLEKIADAISQAVAREVRR
jgi:two-component system chemotaxis response regulator CheB